MLNSYRRDKIRCDGARYEDTLVIDEKILTQPKDHAHHVQERDINVLNVRPHRVPSVAKERNACIRIMPTVCRHPSLKQSSPFQSNMYHKGCRHRDSTNQCTL